MSNDRSYIGRAFLSGMAKLCGAPRLVVPVGHLRVIAEQHDTTLVAECGVNTSEVLRRELNVFDDLTEAASRGQNDDAQSKQSSDSHPVGFPCLGTTCAPLAPGTLDQLVPPTPALLHYPTRRGQAVADPCDGDTLVPMNEVGMLVGQGAAGKSMFFLQLAVAVAANMPFLGRFPVGEAAAGRPVFLVFGEDRREQIIRRLQLISRKLLAHVSSAERRNIEAKLFIASVAGIGQDRLLINTLNGSPMTSSSFGEWATGVLNVQPALVVADPLSRLLSGNIDLSSEVGTAWVAMLESLVQQANEPISVWFAHHSNKLSRRSNVTREDDEPDARGTSGLFDAVRVEGYLAALPNAQVAFRIRKNNHGPRMEFKDRVILAREEHGILRALTTEEQDDLTVAREKEKARARDEADVDTTRRIAVALALNPKTTNKDTLRGIVGRGKATFDRAFSTLLAAQAGRSPLVTQAKRGSPFVIGAAEMAKAYPDLIDTEQNAVIVGRWCGEDWPQAIRDPDAAIPLSPDPTDDQTQTGPSAESGRSTEEPPNGDNDAASGGLDPTSRLSPLKGDTQSGRLGRQGGAPKNALTLTDAIGPDSKSVQSPVAVRSVRPPERSVA